MTAACGGESNCGLPKEKVEKDVPVPVLVLVRVLMEVDDDKEVVVQEKGCCATVETIAATFVDASSPTPYWSRWSTFPAEE